MKIENKIKETTRKQRTSPINMYLPAQREMESLDERCRMKTVEIYGKPLKDRERNPYPFFLLLWWYLGYPECIKELFGKVQPAGLLSVGYESGHTEGPKVILR